MTSGCIFCRIATGDLPAHKLYEDEHILAFLDLHPVREGHALVIPRDHHVWFEDLPEPLATRITSCAQALARGMKRLYRVERVALFYTGIHVPHAHAHVVPMHHVHDVTSGLYMERGLDEFVLPPSPPPADLARVAAELRAELT